MGMAAYFTAISPDQLEALRADPGLVEALLFPDGDGDDDEPDNTVDVDKAWHGLHFLLGQLAGAFDPAAMSQAQIYPEIWERDGQEALAYLLHYHPVLAGFYRAAAARGDAALLWLA